VAPADATIQSAAGQDIGHRYFGCQPEWIVEWQRMQECTEANFIGFLSDRTDQRQRVCRNAEVLKQVMFNGRI
jgi:hypothetical protein